MSWDAVSSMFGPIAALIAGAWALLKILIWQFEKRLDERENRQSERFAALAKVRVDDQKEWQERHGRLDEKYEKLNDEVRQMLIDMPQQFVARTDYVRRESVVEGKIDQLSLRIQDWILEKRNG